MTSVFENNGLDDKLQKEKTACHYTTFSLEKTAHFWKQVIHFSSLVKDVWYLAYNEKVASKVSFAEM